jgi:TM2 domain-containing membrane protein YozV
MMRAPLPIAACVLLLPALALGQPPPSGPPAPEEAAPIEEAPVEEPVPPASAKAASLDALETLRFADHLFADGDWYRAITEYRRFLFQVRGRSEEAPRAALAIGEALLRGEQYDAAGRQLDGVASRTTDMEQRRTALFGAGRAYLLDQRPELAKPRLRLLAEDEEAADGLRHEARWLLAWGHFDAGELDEAYKQFSGLAEAGGRHAEDASGAAQALLDRERLEQKNPLLAGALSLIPGFGHFYLGRWGVGLTSLAWNGLFLFATVSAWLTGNWGVALVLTLFEIGWYSGGVFGAVAGAMRHNRDVVRNWRDDLLLRYGAGRELPDLEELFHRTDAGPGTLPHFGAPARA